jgi:hypothetical protein
MRNKRGGGGLLTPQVHDLTEDLAGYGVRPSTAAQVEQLEFIRNFNKALPMKKKLKESLPLIPTANVGTLQVVRKDYRKKKTEVLTKYTPIGIVDDFFNPNEEKGSKFSMEGRARLMSA